MPGACFRFFLFACICLLQVKHSFPQEPLFKNYTAETGLISTNVYTVFQDSKGYVWFGTESGVSRFDGYFFQNFTMEDGLSDNEVFSIHEDSQGRIWFLTLNGIPSYFLDNQFYNRSNTKWLAQAEQNDFTASFFEDDLGNVYLTAPHSSVVVIKPDNTVKKYLNNNKFILVGAWKNPGQEAQVISSRGVTPLNKIHLNDSLRLPWVGIKSRMFTDASFVYFSQFKTLYRYGRYSHAFEAYFQINEQDKEITFINQSTTGELIVGTRNGVYCEEKQDSKVFVKSLQGSIVSGSLYDSEGGAWFSTLNNGVYYSPYPHLLSYSTRSGLAENKVTCLRFTRDSTLWIGMGLGHYASLKQHTLSNYILPGNEGHPVTDIFLAPDSALWITGKSATLKIRDNVREKVPVTVNDLLFDSKGMIWLGYGFLFRFDPIGWEDFKKINQRIWESNGEFTLLEEIQEMISPVRVYKLAEDAAGQVWVASEKGLQCWRGEEMTDYGKKFPQLNGRIIDIVYSGFSQSLWVATRQKGLVEVKNGEIISQWNKGNGLTNDRCRTLHLDSAGNIWVGTDRGLNKLVKNNSDSSHSYTILNGLISTSINAIETNRNDVYLGTDHGLVILPESEIQSTQLAFPVHLDLFEIDNANFLYSKKRFFSHKTQTVSFGFKGLSYRDQGSLIYHYRLFGADLDWRTTQSTSVQYSGLAPGKYKFEVHVSNQSGAESNFPAIVHFEIQQPFWLSWWFKTILLLILLAMLVTGIRIRILFLRNRHRLEQKALTAEKNKLEIEKKLIELEQRALRMQMNPHFIFNALNTMKGYYAESNAKEAGLYISKFSRLMRLILENTAPLIPLEIELEILNYYLELTKIRYPETFEYEISVDAKIDKTDMGIPPMLLQPFLENSVIHGLAPLKKKGLLKLNFSLEDGFLLCQVEDNGIGIEQSKKTNVDQIYKSTAISITRQRLRFMNPEIKNEKLLHILDKTSLNNGTSGTLVYVRIPVQSIWKS